MWLLCYCGTEFNAASHINAITSSWRPINLSNPSFLQTENMSTRNFGHSYCSDMRRNALCRLLLVTSNEKQKPTLNDRRVVGNASSFALL
jgi:hypothetical protein